MMEHYFIEPTDTVFFRGNSAFGESGQHGASILPPQPSVFAGAFRSTILAHRDGALAAFTANGNTGDPVLDAALGTLDPSAGTVLTEGTFSVAWTCFALRAGASLRLYHSPPADLVLSQTTTGNAQSLHKVLPRSPSRLERTSSPLPLTASVRSPVAAKPLGSWYLAHDGWHEHLRGDLPDAQTSVVEASALHRRDPRLGIGLDTHRRAAADGLIYTTDGYAFTNVPDSRGRGTAAGFVVALTGSADCLPASGFVRLGGDGRSARFTRLEGVGTPSPPPLSAESGFRLLLLTPGLFEGGWLPDGVSRTGGEYRLQLDNAQARLVCASLGRSEIASGWDLFLRRPKPAQRCVPSGAVYWFDQFEGDSAAVADWAATGLASHALSPERRAEGFNRATTAAWSGHSTT